MSETANMLYYVHMLGILMGLVWISMGVYFQMIFDRSVRPITVVSCVVVGAVLILLSNAIIVDVRSTEVFLKILAYTFMGMLASAFFTYLVMTEGGGREPRT